MTLALPCGAVSVAASTRGHAEQSSDGSRAACVCVGAPAVAPRLAPGTGGGTAEPPLAPEEAPQPSCCEASNPSTRCCSRALSSASSANCRLLAARWRSSANRAADSCCVRSAMRAWSAAVASRHVSLAHVAMFTRGVWRERTTKHMGQNCNSVQAPRCGSRRGGCVPQHELACVVLNEGRWRSCTYVVGRHATPALERAHGALTLAVSSAAPRIPATLPCSPSSAPLVWPCSCCRY